MIICIANGFSKFVLDRKSCTAKTSTQNSIIHENPSTSSTYKNFSAAKIKHTLNEFLNRNKKAGEKVIIDVVIQISNHFVF